MPNTTVRANAEGMPNINRRAAIAATTGAVAALLASNVPAPAATSPLLDLIENHKRAHAAFLAAIDGELDAESAYTEAHPGSHKVEVPLSIGGSVFLHVSELHQAHHIAECRRDIASLYKEKDTPLPEVAKALRKAQAHDLRTMRRLLNEEYARREAFGLRAAYRANSAASDAETDAAAALLAYPCLTLEEIRIRAEYLTANERGGGNIILDALHSGEDRLVRALLFASLEGGEA